MKSQEHSPPSVTLWSVLVGVLISRGDWDTAVDILIKMENSDNIQNNKNNIEIKDYFNKGNNYYNNDVKNDKNNFNDVFDNTNNNRNYNFDNMKSKKIKKFKYKASDVSQAVELAILYSLEGGLPLLTKTSSKALLAMDLQRLLPKDQISIITENIDAKSRNYSKLQNNNDDDKNNKNKNDNDKDLCNFSDNTNVEKGNSYSNGNGNSNGNSNSNMNSNKDIKSLLISPSSQNFNLNGISHTLRKLPQDLNLRACDNRTVSSMGDVLGFLERCRGDDFVDAINFKEKEKVKEREIMEKGEGKMKQRILYDDIPSDDYADYDDEIYNTRKSKNEKKNVKTKIPVGVLLLQSLFADAINERKFKQAARIIRLLEWSDRKSVV